MKFLSLCAATGRQASELTELFSLYDLHVSSPSCMALHVAGGIARVLWRGAERPRVLLRRSVLAAGQELVRQTVVARLAVEMRHSRRGRP